MRPFVIGATALFSVSWGGSPGGRSLSEMFVRIGQAIGPVVAGRLMALTGGYRGIRVLSLIAPSPEPPPSSGGRNVR
ncbi:hypothetical protein [Streptomyces caeruleatus]|uniref:Uncharacterized protein n=1 Tax=Streptomyces caeruleatus TaxID=661399 RepID=A0A117RRP6_9ACTN|nr:hypothetical protein [Streptomyces caeruleatus]KUO05556.1 hypothetical protein AQJ67_05245 [Streptomyces caeruleatus]